MAGDAWARSAASPEWCAKTMKPWPSRLRGRHRRITLVAMGSCLRRRLTILFCSAGLVLTVAFVDGASAATPILSSAVSRKVHGVAGTFDLSLSTSLATPTVEPRSGPNHTIVFLFDRAVVSGSATVIEGIATIGATQFSGQQVVVGLTGVANQQYVTVTLSSVQGGDVASWLFRDSCCRRPRATDRNGFRT